MAFSFSKKKFFKKIILGISALLKYIIGGIAESFMFSYYPYCDDCFAKLEESAIKSYNYKPEPIFYGSGNY